MTDRLDRRYFKSINLVFYFVLVLLCISQPAHSQDITEYQLVPGDRIAIQVYGEPDLSFTELLIPNDGLISYPFLGEIKASGKSESELAAFITAGLKDGYILSPQVRVDLAAFRPIFLGGAVVAPGLKDFLVNLDVERVVAAAGGFSDNADRENIVILRENSAGRTEFNASLSTPVEPGDVITVHAIPPEEIEVVDPKQYVYLYGEVSRPGRYEYYPDLSVEKAIVIAGGFGPRASKRKISVSRGNPAKIEKKVPLDFLVMPGDIITIGASLF